MSEEYLKNARRVKEFVENFFQKSGETSWPNFSQVSRSLKITMKTIVEFTDENILGLMHTEYNVRPRLALGGRFVEVCE